MEEAAIQEDKLINWQELFIPTVPAIELILRGSLVYLVLFALLRFVLKRGAGTFSLGDLLMIVLLADAAQNAMSVNYTSVTDGMVLVATIIFWAYMLDWLGQYFPRFGKLIHPPPTPLIRDGKMLAGNMRRELITVDELMSHLREQNVKDLREVQSAFLEGDGRISVVKHNGDTPAQPEQRAK